MTRRSRAPRTPGRSIRVEVATGGDPVGAYARQLPWRPGEVWSVGVHHDDGCPALAGAPMLACTCEIVEIRGRRVG